MIALKKTEPVGILARVVKPSTGGAQKTEKRQNSTSAESALVAVLAYPQHRYGAAGEEKPGLQRLYVQCGVFSCTALSCVGTNKSVKNRLEAQTSELDSRQPVRSV